MFLVKQWDGFLLGQASVRGLVEASNFVRVDAMLGGLVFSSGMPKLEHLWWILRLIFSPFIG
jgi:hypothetical protein